MNRTLSDIDTISPTLLLSLLDQSDDAFIAVRAQDGRIVFANERATAYADCDRNELIGRPLYEFSQDLQMADWSVLAEQCRSARQLVFKTRVDDPAGRSVPIDVNARYIETADGDYIVGSLKNTVDIDHISAELADSERRFRTLAEHSLVGVYVIQRGRIRYANPHLARLFGYETDAMIDMPIAALVHEDDYEEVREKLRQREAGELWKAHYQFRARRRNGTYFPVEVSGCAVAYLGATATVGTLLVVDERQRIEQALEQSEQHLRLTLKAAHQGWYDLNVESGGIKVSDEYAEMLGYDPAGFTENLSRWAERMHPDDRQSTVSALNAYIQGKIPEFRAEFRQQTRSGDWVWLISIGSIVERDDQGAALRILGTHRNIDKRKHTEMAVRKLNDSLAARVRRCTEQLLTINKESAAFAHAVTHDLTAPLRGIDGYCRLLLENCRDKLGNEGELFVANIRSGVSQMYELIADLSSFPHRHEQSSALARFELSNLITRIATEKRNELACRSIELNTDVATGLTVQADYQDLQAVLRLLIDYAMLMPSPANASVLTIEAGPKGECSRIRLGRHGLNSRPDILRSQEHVEMLKTALDIVQQTVTRMGGRIWLENDTEAASAIFLELPR
ncbi:MAG: PAS domain S-box protein [Gammaproteobacteria bacterium]